MLIKNTGFALFRKLCYYRTAFTAAQATNTNEFDISAALALYRSSIIAPPMTDIEKRFVNVSSTIEIEKSLKSNFELKLEKDRILYEKRKILESEGKDLSELDEQIGVSNIQLINDWMKEGSETFKRFGLDNVNCDVVGDQLSLHRKFDRKLVLLVREKLFSNDKNYSSPWILPQLKNNGEPLCETVDKCIEKLIDGNLNIRVLGNAPFACIKHIYPKPVAEKTKSSGNYIFFYSAEIHSKNPAKPDFNKNFVSEFCWCTPEEVKTLIMSKKYKKCLETILYE